MNRIADHDSDEREVNGKDSNDTKKGRNQAKQAMIWENSVLWSIY